jgi:hypothetical protein
MRATTSIIITILVIFYSSCKGKKIECDNVVSSQRATYSGLIMYHNTSQDGMRDFLFFPICEVSNSFVFDSTFTTLNFKRGIQFKLPLSGTDYANILRKSKKMLVNDVSERQIINYLPVSIEFDHPENNTKLFSSKDEDWIFEVNLGNASKKLYYFVSNNSHLIKVEALDWENN